MTRQILWAVAIGFHIAVAVTAGGCRLPLSVACGNDWCSLGQHCGDPETATPVCVLDSCGNGQTDPDEQCDDGNSSGGDGCSANCVRERCGNGFKELNEECEDHNDFDGDGCSSNCTIEQCGNHILDRLHGEQCDDGNEVDGDGCTVSCTLPSCGNGIMDRYEQCDDHNTVDGDGCSSNCTIEVCGNRIVDLARGEQCDDGNHVDGDGCSASCTLERCGNGSVDHIDGVMDVEQCDDNNRSSGDGCSSNCTIEKCGNGIVDGAAGEECDPPSVTRGCSLRCKLEHCGNGVVDPGEACDGADFGPGGNPDGLTCATDCHVPWCGNGVKEVAEDCDDGNPDGGHGCSGGSLAQGGCKIEFCGDGIVNNQTPTSHEDCDGGSGGVATPTPTCNLDCTVPSCGDGVVNPRFTPPGAPGPEQCDPPAVGSGCSATCQFEHCSNGIRDPGEECDGSDFGPGGNPGALTCAADCHIPRCGNGRLDPGEQCDDGDTRSGDGCAQDCTIEFCGDGVNNNRGREACDTGGAAQGCNANCTLPSCGDGIVNPQFTPPDAAGPEQCDPPSVANGCSAACRFEHCGNGSKDPGEECDGTDFGSGGNPGGRTCARDCHIEQCGNGRLDPGEECDVGDGADGHGCSATCKFEFCGDGIVNDQTATSHEDCDGGSGGAGPVVLLATATATCNRDCTTARCGDAIVNPLFTPADAPGPEQCDPPSVADGCSATCQFEHCGNGIKDPGEQCDGTDFGSVEDIDALTCTANCHIEQCGNGIKDPGEQCDDGNSGGGDGCSATCQFERCGNGIRDVGEECDDGNRVNGDSCEADCSVPVCGNAIRDADESCDDGNRIDGDFCEADCSFPTCGNGILDLSIDEVCDDGNRVNDDGCSADCRSHELCGDGLVEFDHGEECDDGNTVAGDGCGVTCRSEPLVTTSPVLISGAGSCTTADANTSRKVAVDSGGTIYAVMRCGTSGFVVVSTDRGQTFSPPLDLTTRPSGPVEISQIAVASPYARAGTAYVAFVATSGAVGLRTTTNFGATWSGPDLRGLATNPSVKNSGLEIAAFNDDLYIGFARDNGADNRGIAVVHSHDHGGTFATTQVNMTSPTFEFFDVTYDPRLRTVAVTSDTADFHVRLSNDRGSTFAGEVNPPGQAPGSDWTMSNGQLFVVGTGQTPMYVIPTATSTTSTAISGLPVVNTPQGRSVTADHAGNAFVGSQLDGGGVQLDRLPIGATAFDATRLISATGGSPSMAPLGGNQGVAMIYTVDNQVWATVQVYK